MWSYTEIDFKQCRRSPQVSVNIMFYLKPNCTKLANYTHLQTILILNALLISLLRTRRQPTNGFALIGAHQIGAVPELNPNWTDFGKYTHLKITLVLRETHLEIQLGSS
ncbi:hypothetical protein CSKR_109768 [Clonorchis sinensis]|uniref:Uncharacterized protein n=1 Tax=Clonorchis sinensis TaxID=79923 RepID=A0A3R7D9R5_CLOSI|nr:hypothetical protein CSKR_109768 [Clonorchis sinensis]